MCYCMTISSVNKNCFFPCMAWKRTYRASVGVPIQPKSRNITSFPASSSLQISLPSRVKFLPSTDAHTSTLAGRNTCGVRICMKLAMTRCMAVTSPRSIMASKSLRAEALPSSVHVAFAAGSPSRRPASPPPLYSSLC